MSTHHSSDIARIVPPQARAALKRQGVGEAQARRNVRVRVTVLGGSLERPLEFVVDISVRWGHVARAVRSWKTNKSGRGGGRNGGKSQEEGEALHGVDGAGVVGRLR